MVCDEGFWEDIEKMRVGMRTESDYGPIEITLQKERSEVTKGSEKTGVIEDCLEVGFRGQRDNLKIYKRKREEGKIRLWKKLRREIVGVTVKKRIKRRKPMAGRRAW